jgi:hypothetical protein
MQHFNGEFGIATRGLLFPVEECGEYVHLHQCGGWGLPEKSIGTISLEEALIKQMQTRPEIETIIECEGEDADELWILGRNLNSSLDGQILFKK